MKPMTVLGTHEPDTIAQLENCLRVGNTVGGVLCADGHLGYAQPVGAVIAYKNQVSVSGVGFDIGCGNTAIRLDVKAADLKPAAATLLADIKAKVSFGVGRTNNQPADHALFDAPNWADCGMLEYKKKAQAQLGTVGGGNHYVDLFEDDNGYAWIGVHFGSRGLGHTIATKFLKAAGGKDGMHVDPTVLDIDSDLGRQYMAGMELAGVYAEAGRAWVIDTVRNIIGAHETKRVDNHHNFAWEELHNNHLYWVVRKGATPNHPGQQSFVGGSMGDNAVIIEGVASDANAAIYNSTVHGAGRTMGRKAAKRTFTREQMNEWLARVGVVVAGGDLDESPMAYRRLSEVLVPHANTFRLVHTLKPFAVAMAGSDDYDPWKD